MLFYHFVTELNTGNNDINISENVTAIALSGNQWHWYQQSKPQQPKKDTEQKLTVKQTCPS